MTRNLTQQKKCCSPAVWVVLLFLLTLLPGALNAAAGDEVEGVIEVGTDVIEDPVISQRLTELLRQSPAMQNLEVSVSSGVVYLRGRVDTTAAREDAVSLSKKVAGVVMVVDQVEVDTTIRKRMLAVARDLRVQLGDLIVKLPLFIVAAAIFGLFWYLGRVATDGDRISRRLSENPFLKSLMSQVSRFLIVLVGVLLALSVLDATGIVKTVLGAAGILGLAVSFAIRDTVENYIASMLLSLRQPFAPKDHVIIAGHEGKVVRLTSRDTILMTLSGNHVRIPNAAVYKGEITNFSRNNKRRFNFSLSLDRDTPINQALELAEQTLRDAPGVIDDPAPSVSLDSIAESGVVVSLFAWTDQNEFDFSKVRSEAIRFVKDAFDNAEIEFSRPMYRLKMDKDKAEVVEPAASRREDKRANDVSRETHLDEAIEEENRQESEQDLLKPVQEKP